MASNIYNPQSHYHHQEHTAPPATDDLLDSKSKNENESQASSVAANTAPTTPGSVSNTLNESTATAAPTSTAADDDQVNLNAVDDKETPSVTPAKTAEPSDATSTTQQGSTAENLNNDGDVQMQD
ncbi:hypothetical protein G6F42_018744 [Rhizopus arrhizus]|nr:hypothetical protein G6F42_018744 [Rhizopus arrhizus]